MLDSYFEFDLSEKDSFSGIFNEQTGQMEGPGIFTRKDKFIYIGNFIASQFQGLGAHIDLLENTLYVGNFYDSQKEGFGCLTKFKSGQEINQITEPVYKNQKETFLKLVEFWTAKAQDAINKAKRKSDRLIA